MTDWRVKSAVHGVISVLPRSQELNYLLQRKVTHSVDIDRARAAQRLAVVRDRHVSAVRRHRQRGLEEVHVVELGTGWHPFVPLGLYLYGCASVTTFDIDSLLRDREVSQTMRTAVEAVRADPDEFAGIVPERLERLAAMAERSAGVGGLAELGITATVGDARTSGLPDGSVQLVVSNNVMEHVARPLIAGLYREFARISAPDALLSQRIDMRDHFARADRSIGPYNYLQYSDRAWKVLGSRMEHQNRLRYPQHLQLLADNGWTVIDDQPTFGSPEALEAVEVHPEFLHLDRDDLRVLDTWLVAEPTSR